jgi:hypothetical protein
MYMNELQPMEVPFLRRASCQSELPCRFARIDRNRFPAKKQ